MGGAPGGGDTARRSREGLDDGLRERLGRLRVLARDELSALRDDDVRRPRVALAVLAALAREALLVRPGEGLDGFRLAMASFSRDFLSQLKALELVSTERMATRSCGGRREKRTS